MFRVFDQVGVDGSKQQQQKKDSKDEGEWGCCTGLSLMVAIFLNLSSLGSKKILNKVKVSGRFIGYIWILGFRDFDEAWLYGHKITKTREEVEWVSQGVLDFSSSYTLVSRGYTRSKNMNGWTRWVRCAIHSWLELFFGF